jgi:hypothetical protein
MSDSLMLGQYGAYLVDSGTQAMDPPAHTIEAANGEDLVWSALVESGSDVASKMTTLPSGQRTYGVFTSITVTSGVARCYKIRPS